MRALVSSEQRKRVDVVPAPAGPAGAEVQAARAEAAEAVADCDLSPRRTVSEASRR